MPTSGKSFRQTSKHLRVNVHPLITKQSLEFHEPFPPMKMDEKIGLPSSFTCLHLNHDINKTLTWHFHQNPERFIGIPYNLLLWSLYNWTVFQPVFHPLNTANKQSFDRQTSNSKVANPEKSKEARAACGCFFLRGPWRRKDIYRQFDMEWTGVTLLSLFSCFWFPSRW